MADRRHSSCSKLRDWRGYPRVGFQDRGTLVGSEQASCLHFILSNKILFLQVANARHRDKTPQRKFSTLIKRMVVELDRDPTLYADGNIVEVSNS